MPYGETSKILKLLSPDAGLVSAIARGARSAKARTGPRLDLFAAGSATLLTRATRDLHPLTSFDVTDPHAALSRDVGKFAAASALTEIVLRCAPPEPHPEIFEALTAGLDALEHAGPDDAATVALLACWGIVAALGFAPALDRCVVCGEPTEGALAFSAMSGGALCDTHRRGTRTASLAPDDAAALEALVQGRMPPALDARHVAAHRRLLLGFIRQHLAEQREMPALAFWDQDSWNATRS